MNASILSFVIALLVASATTVSAEKSRFPKVDGSLIVGKFLDIDDGGRVFIRFGRFSDSGAEITRESKDGAIMWHFFVKPLMVAHSSYRHEVSAYQKDGKLYVTSEGFKTIKEEIDLATGKQLSRQIIQGEQAAPRNR
jgi:hypothetical protein